MRLERTLLRGCRTASSVTFFRCVMEEARAWASLGQISAMLSVIHPASASAHERTLDRNAVVIVGVAYNLWLDESLVQAPY